MDLEAVSDALGIKPSVLWKVGEPRRTPKGTALSGIYKTGFWTCRLVDGASIEQDLSSALSAALDKVAPGSPLFATIAQTGGRVEFFIGWFFDDGNSGDVLDHNLLGRLAGMSIDLSFDVYGDAEASSD
jgi:hypothetical protein